MKFILMLTVIGVVSYCFVPCLAATACDFATPGAKSKVICVSKTKFKFSVTDREALECPPGTVCADVAEICSTNLNTALCKNTVVGSMGTCNECRNTDIGQVCISETEYSICSGGKVLSTLKYSCEISKPYCKAAIDPSGVITAICQAKKEDLDCPQAVVVTTTPTPNISTEPTAATSSTNTTTPSTPTDVTCTAEGLFPDTSDTTCTRYYKCSRNQSGSFVSAKFQCLSAGQAFNPATQRCEPAANVNCNAI